MCPVTATPSSIWAPTQPDQKASSDRISSFAALTTSLSCSPLCQQLTEKKILMSVFVNTVSDP
jgi:hypothetical protein